MILIDKQKTTPTHGCLSKAWYSDGKDMLLVKGNSKSENGFCGYEPYAEVIASIVADALNIVHISYYLQPAYLFPDVKTYKCYYVSVCKLFTINSTSQKLKCYKLFGGFLWQGYKCQLLGCIVKNTCR